MNPLRIVISEEAVQDLKHYASFIAEDNPEAAERFIQSAERVFQNLARSPYMGPARSFQQRQLQGLRSWRIPGFKNYLVFYRVEKDYLDIVRVIHGAMDLEQELL